MSNPLNSSEQSMLPSLLTFFRDPDNFDILLKYRKRSDQGKTKFSASLLDWFTVNYAKKYGVQYEILKNGRKKIVHVEQSYNAALSAYNKEYFDPFARGIKKGHGIVIEGNNGITVTTTVRQLNYFRWAISNGIIEYVDRNVDQIYEDMCLRSNRGKKKVNGKKHQLSVSACKTLGVYNGKLNSVKISVKFNDPSKKQN